MISSGSSERSRRRSAGWPARPMASRSARPSARSVNMTVTSSGRMRRETATRGLSCRRASRDSSSWSSSTSTPRSRMRSTKASCSCRACRTQITSSNNSSWELDRREPFVGEVGPMDHHRPERPDLRVRPDRCPVAVLMCGLLSYPTGGRSFEHDARLEPRFSEGSQRARAATSPVSDDGRGPRSEGAEPSARAASRRRLPRASGRGAGSSGSRR